MTNKEFYQAVINLAISEEMTEKAKHLLELTEKRNEKRSEQQSANYAANIKIFNDIAALMEKGKIYAISEINELIAETDYKSLSRAKLTAVFKTAVGQELATVVDDYKVGGKGREVKGYTIK